MATLRMNTDQARSTASTLQNSHTQIQTALSSLSSSAATLQGEWQGQSSDQFQTEYGQWRDGVNRALEALQSLKTRLDAEITEWEAVAARL